MENLALLFPVANATAETRASPDDGYVSRVLLCSFVQHALKRTPQLQAVELRQRGDLEYLPIPNFLKIICLI